MLKILYWVLSSIAIIIRRSAPMSDHIRSTQGPVLPPGMAPVGAGLDRITDVIFIIVLCYNPGQHWRD